MSKSTRNESPPVEEMDSKTTLTWTRLSAQVVAARREGRGGRINELLESAAFSDPQSPAAPAYRLWAADNLAREACYADAVVAYDAAIDSTRQARPFHPRVDAIGASLLHKAQAAALGRDSALAIATYVDLARVSGEAAPLYSAGAIAEETGEHARAADLYGSVAGESPSHRTDMPAELARRALLRLDDTRVRYFSDAWALAERIGRSLELHDIADLERLISKTHFAVGPMGGHTVFEEPDVLEHFYRELMDCQVLAQPSLLGSGGKFYLLTTGWKGRWYRGDVVCVLTRSPRGWQWTGLGLTAPTDRWHDRWRPVIPQSNQPLPFAIRAPWPSGQSFMAGGVLQYIAQQAAIVGSTLFGGVLLAYFASRRCGFGVRGLYYNQPPTHTGEDAFAIDFTRYRRFVPYDNESGGTPVLAVRDGLVVRVSAGSVVGHPDVPNLVHVAHVDPADPNAIDRFRSIYLHLAGPFLIDVSEMMPVIVGQRLGLMDDTGNSLLHHLHFSMHDRNLSHPSVSYGRSVRPTPMSSVRLEDGDSGTCLRSDNVERFPGLNFVPPAVSFGSVPIGEVRTRTVVAQNSTGADVGLSFPASENPAPFRWEAFSGTLPNDAQMSIAIEFHSASHETVFGTLTVTSTASGSPHEVSLLGKGPGGFEPQPDPPTPTPPVEFVPASINFGTVLPGIVRTKTLTIRNPTEAAIDVAFPAAPELSPFDWAAFSDSLAKGEQRDFALRFSPTSSVVSQTTLMITSTVPGSPHAVVVKGKGAGGFDPP